MSTIGTPFSSSATKVMLCGAGELAKEVVIEFKRLGVEVIAVDRYANAPAMQVADKSYVFSMLDGDKLKEVIRAEKPDFIIPEIEAIATKALLEMEKEGFNVIPTAYATDVTMNREGIRNLVAEKLKLRTSPFAFAATFEEFTDAVKKIGIPCVVKPVMSSSGKGQSVIKSENDIETSWTYAHEGARGGADKVIVEGFIDFDFEITLLTVRHKGGTSFCQPIGHVQVDGDYRVSWQPQAMSEEALQEAEDIALEVTDSLGGYGIFGVEFFVKDNIVYFSELSPRPHDTGMVTLISQDLSEFALHARAILGLPVPAIRFRGPSASYAVMVKGESKNVKFSDVDKALSIIDTDLKIFGKPEVVGERRMAVALARDTSTEKACEKAKKVAETLKIEL